MVFPALLTLLLLALQPVCLLYTRSVMESVASETARLMVSGSDEVEVYERFAYRRLAAVPDLAIFQMCIRDRLQTQMTRHFPKSIQDPCCVASTIESRHVCGAD